MTLKSIMLAYLNQVCFTSYHKRGLSKSIANFKTKVYIPTQTQTPVWTKLNSVTVAKTNTMEPAPLTAGLAGLKCVKDELSKPVAINK